MSIINKVTVGADPELFLYSNIEKEVISAEGLIGGSKDEIREISNVGHGLQEDNVMVEFTIPPAIDSDSFCRDINFCLDNIDKHIGEDIDLLISSAEILDKKYLKTEQAMMFGCEPDYNVYLGGENKRPSANGCLRSAGGHIHIGYNNPNIEINEELVRHMDLFLGVPSVLLDDDTDRRTMYGKAGSFRFKKYGIEYRTLSNFWIGNDELIKWAFNSTIKAVENINNKNTIKSYSLKEIQECINTSNKKSAIKILKDFNIKLDFEKLNKYEKCQEIMI